MKLLRLDLLAYGPFTNISLDFSREDAGFHLLYGSNEAGKSTLLRAVRGLLFGIPARSPDNFLHEHASMRIGARLRRSDGRDLEVVRRKGLRNTLLDATQGPLDENTMRGWTGGITEDLFSHFFGLDHEQLASGGTGLLAAQGHASESLFAAGLGGVQLKKLCDELEAEASSLFKPRGDNQSLNKALRDYTASKEQNATQLLAGDVYEQHDQALGRALREQAEIHDQLRMAVAELNRLERMKKSLPLVAERRMLQEALLLLGPVPVLPAAFTQQRTAAMAALDNARALLEQSAAKSENLKAQIDHLSPPQSLLENAELVTDLHQRLGGHLKAAQDVPGLRGQLHRLEEDSRRLHDQLKPGWPLERADAMRVSPAASALIQDLGGKIVSLREGCRKTRLDQERLMQEIAHAEIHLAALPPPRNIQPLQSAVRLALRDAAADLRQLTANLASREAEAAALMQRLELWRGSIEEAVTAPIPSQEAVEPFALRFDQWKKRLEHLDARMTETAAQLAETGQALCELRLALDVPSEQDLTEARRRREADWRTVKDAWHEKRADGPALLESAEPLEKAFEESVNRADTLADRLRREAGRVEKLASLNSQKQSRETALAGLKTEREEHWRQQDGLDADWRSLWHPAGIAPRSPAEMRSWIQKWDRLVQLSEQLLRDRAQRREMEQRIQAHKERLRQCLETMGESHPPLEAPLEIWLDRCQQAAETVERTETDRKLLEGKIHERKLQSHTMSLEASMSEALLASATRDWAAALARIGLTGDETPVEVNAILTLMAELSGKLDTAAGLRSRLQAIDGDAIRFAGEVDSLVRLLAPDLAPQPPGTSVVQLHRRLLSAQQDQAKRRILLSQLEGEQSASEKAREQIHQFENVLRQLCQKAGCAGTAELEPIEQKSARAQTTLRRLEEVEKHLLMESGGLTVEEFAASVATESPDILTSRIGDLARTLENLELKRSEWDKAIGSEATLLKLMDGNAQAATAAEDAAAKLAEIQQLASRYVQARLSCGILKREMERYRAENQDPILRRAQDIFSQITLGSFAAIATDYDAQDTPVLKGVRPDGGKVPVEGMSDGTRDQLFLALRLATIEKYLAANEPMPLIVDDILIHFDDRRAKAALAFLGELSGKTQILFFTHHARLMELAREAIPSLETHILRQ